MNRSEKDYDKPSVYDVFNNTGVNISEQENLINEAIVKSWKQSEDQGLKDVVSYLGKSKIRNFGTASTTELIGKLGIWLVEAGVTEIPKDYVPKKKTYVW